MENQYPPNPEMAGQMYDNGYYDELGYWHVYTEEQTRAYAAEVAAAEQAALQQQQAEVQIPPNPDMAGQMYDNGYYDELGYWRVYTEEQTRAYAAEVAAAEQAALQQQQAEVEIPPNPEMAGQMYDNGYYDELGYWRVYTEEQTRAYAAEVAAAEQAALQQQQAEVEIPPNPEMAGQMYDNGYYDELGYWRVYTEEQTRAYAAEVAAAEQAALQQQQAEVQIPPNPDMAGQMYDNGYYDELGYWRVYTEEQIRAYEEEVINAQAMVEQSEDINVAFGNMTVGSADGRKLTPQEKEHIREQHRDELDRLGPNTRRLREEELGIKKVRKPTIIRYRMTTYIATPSGDAYLFPFYFRERYPGYVRDIEAIEGSFDPEQAGINPPKPLNQRDPDQKYPKPYVGLTPPPPKEKKQG
ncbi:hypothetical protein L596_019562 [Steinernema carpocapsae]|uniref:Uncharacterized protein n=1 Tax=Steinernema carpocapsae TaxID=34508 RepID=A0A4U5MQV5_STECR|nr:hypothetical protein L596_019562 [Steinernema carpocapsae]